MQLFVKTIDGKTFVIEAELTDTIISIKSKIGKKLSVSKEFINLIWSGRELRSTVAGLFNEYPICYLTLQDYNYGWNDKGICARIEYDIINAYEAIKLNAAKNRLMYARILRYVKKIPIFVFNPDVMDDSPIKYMTDKIIISEYIEQLISKLIRKKKTKNFLELYEINANHNLINISNEINKLSRTIEILNQLNRSDTESPL